MQIFKMAAKNGGKQFLEKVASQLWGYPSDKNFNKIALSRIVSEINAFLHFTQKFKMATKKWQQNDFWEKSPVDSADTLGVKTFNKIAVSHTVSEEMRLCVLHRNSRWSPKMAGKRFLEKTRQLTLEIPWRSKILTKSLYLAPFEIFTFFNLLLKSQMAAKSSEN